MKKRTAIILSGAVLVSIAAYVAWCFRPFYLPPPLEIDASVSPGGRKAVEDWRWSGSYVRPLEFGWTTAWRNLCHPWDCRMGDLVRVEEQPDSGLWATSIGQFWGFSKIGGEWDASTAMDHGTDFFFSPVHGRVQRQGEIASRIDAMGANGATIEILSLGRLTHLGSLVHRAGEAPDSQPYFPSIFYHYEVFGRATVVEARERQHLLDCLARSIREADIDREPPGWGISPRHGITISIGESRADYLMNFDEGDGYAFGPGIDGIMGFTRTTSPTRTSRSEDLAFFRISPHYGKVFDAFLERNGIEQEEQPATK
ncbi:hypothetical protein OKA05_27065 [Luteolibacter arcticus]|uniref:Uncharacterized protein n=1 Tax=Luteolibacter arcticus TaxID=1581411 RepID=A0ABT3GRZ1_9BACT|nr:hypothetical protein [Luteolibacter arcticus]MCW1926244.1 hypothetical protein [Luteolibacter arcticus]